MKNEKPPFILTGDEGSFARSSLTKRFPVIVDGVLKDFSAAGPSRVRLMRIKDEIVSGTISDPFAAGAGLGSVDASLFETEELEDWKEALRPILGIPWNNAPFFLVEAYLYLRILAAVGYYDRTSEHCLLDPFRHQKEEELAKLLESPEWRDTAETYRSRFEGGKVTSSVAEELLLLSLKGNRIDLSNKGIAEFGRSLVHGNGREDLIIDDGEAIADRILAGRRLDFILDNAGTELVSDLLFAAVYLAAVPGGRVVFHTKKAPMFVSDTMTKDVEATVKALREGPGFEALGTALDRCLSDGSLAVQDHYFWNGPRPFTALPESVRRRLAGSDLILVKGDANFRRLLEDRRWPYSVRLADRVKSFPAPLAILRTLKSEIAADIDEETVKRVSSVDPAWLFDGKWGVLQLVLQ